MRNGVHFGYDNRTAFFHGAIYRTEKEIRKSASSLVKVRLQKTVPVQRFSFLRRVLVFRFPLCVRLFRKLELCQSFLGKKFFDIKRSMSVKLRLMRLF